MACESRSGSPVTARIAARTDTDEDLDGVVSRSVGVLEHPGRKAAGQNVVSTFRRADPDRQTTLTNLLPTPTNLLDTRALQAYVRSIVCGDQSPPSTLVSGRRGLRFEAAAPRATARSIQNRDGRITIAAARKAASGCLRQLKDAGTAISAATAVRPQDQPHGAHHRMGRSSHCSTASRASLRTECSPRRRGSSRCAREHSPASHFQ
jgi:hypothetical protein